MEDDSAHIVNTKLGSSLAAMGMASSVATSLYEKKSDEEADQEGNVETSKMAVVPPLPLQQQEEKLDLASIKAEIQSLVEKTSPGKSTEELLMAYAGKEEELLSHLRRLHRETRG